MDHQRKPQNNAQKSAQTFFTKAGQDESLAKQTRKKERTAVATKTAKLRELRLAKEAADKVEADRMAAEHPEPVRPERRKRAPAAKAAKVMRFTY